MVARSGWLIVAELGRPHGIRGEVTARLSGVDASELVGMPGLLLVAPDAPDRSTRVVGARSDRQGAVLLLEGVSDRNAAEELRGGVVMAPRSALPEPDEDEWYVADLVGMKVVSDEGEELGVLEDVMKLPANDVLVVRGPRGEVLLPLVEEVVRKVDRRSRRVTVHLLPGLLDGAEEA